ncbi:MAG: MBL fold metallo-hydrolase [Candidatus Marinimicrobia bacterium]|jgi:glyoxylase-like metal-dependent hydrolase (beta-lactamase superfamily II)|nr:MBL fold metallo-hydrolase [Pelagibacterales bacterium]MBL6911624.1 MBL fold metallo-hydrolase [Candidatus Neomarinimicrobiota bacterium]MBT3944737.1 MBL fold metallo-hydrolase [Candidatus Neomarinimicrobiota bacterium]MBT4707079.1 MBL fold metallo-hydrolase [Candidatus Neomarinimicrobiota bacterium]MBT5251693.1 MBL fold metallo-hydrolase [Candidatus Neomarinimicrobiota bacterium]
MTQYQRIVTKLLEENTYVIFNEKNDCIIIDPGFGSELIDSFIQSKNLSPIAILATHGHFDHLAGAADLIDKYNLPLYVCDKDKLVVDNFDRAAGYWGVEARKPTVSHWINSADKELIVGDFSFSVIFNPGHSPGCISFIIDNLIFCGDLIFKGSIGRTDLPLSSPRDMATSLKFFVNSFTSDYALLTGHGQETTLYEELKTNPYLMRYEK